MVAPVAQDKEWWLNLAVTAGKDHTMLVPDVMYPHTHCQLSSRARPRLTKQSSNSGALRSTVRNPNTYSDLWAGLGLSRLLCSV